MRVKIAGVGAFVPPIVVTNERLVKAIPGWAPERIEEKTGIRERRYVCDFDAETGRALADPEPTDPGPSARMAEHALLDALASAGMEPGELDGVILTTCTPDQVAFSHDAMVLHRRLGLRPEAFSLMHDDGCGGAMFHLTMARELIESGRRKAIAIVGVTAFSPHLDREAYQGTLELGGKKLGSFLSFYLFGDGAGAIILVRDDTPGDSAILASYSGNEYMDLVVRRGGGGMFPPLPGRAAITDNAFYVDGPLVASTFGPTLRKAIEGALARSAHSVSDVSRFFLHQANKRVLEAFVRDAGLDPERVPMHMECYGNMVSAGTLVLLAEELRAGRVELGSGELVLMSALGAGAQYGAHLIRL